MRWIFALALTVASGCECAKTVDETAKETAHEVTGAGAVERGKRIQKNVEEALQKADKVRDDRADEILKGAKE